MSPRSTPRVALISVGLGRVQRGFERWCGDLYGVLRSQVDCTVYGSADAAGSDPRVPRFLRHTTAVCRRLPVGRGEKTEYKRDCLAFGISLLPELFSRKYDVIHCVDPPIARVFRVLQQVFGFPGRVLFTDGVAAAPANYPPAHHLHVIAQVALDGALRHGIPASHITLVPPGVHTERFASCLAREELRGAHGIPEDTFVVVAVSAIRRQHKRVDYLIEEVSKLPGNVLLWLDGHLEDPDLVEQAKSRLQGRCRITHLPTEQVGELYALADVMVQSSLVEAFGLAVIEALSSGMMVLTHDSPHFRWLVGDRDCMLDMSVAGNLTERLRLLCAQPETLCRRSLERAERARRLFDWRSLTPQYLQMYHKVAGRAMAAEA